MRNLISEMGLDRESRDAITNAVKHANPDKAKIIVDWQSRPQLDGQTDFEIRAAFYEIKLDGPLYISKTDKAGHFIRVYSQGDRNAEARLLHNEHTGLTCLTGKTAAWMLDDCERNFGPLCPAPDFKIPPGRYDYRYASECGGVIDLKDVRHPRFMHVLAEMRGRLIPNDSVPSACLNSLFSVRAPGN